MYFLKKKGQDLKKKKNYLGVCCCFPLVCNIMLLLLSFLIKSVPPHLTVAATGCSSPLKTPAHNVF